MPTEASDYMHIAKKATNLSLAAEVEVAKAVAERRAEIWLKENKKAFDCWNTYVEKNGLPLEKHRRF